MRSTDIKIGAWIIWDRDTHPYPRQIVKKLKDKWRISKLEHCMSSYDKDTNKYITDKDNCTISQLWAARLCREDEIPEEFKIKTYEIY